MCLFCRYKKVHCWADNKDVFWWYIDGERESLPGQAKYDPRSGVLFFLLCQHCLQALPGQLSICYEKSLCLFFSYLLLYLVQTEIIYMCCYNWNARKLHKTVLLRWIICWVVSQQPVDIKSWWRHNWKLAQVVDSYLVCDPTIWQPGFNLSWQQWSLLNRFCTEQGHCGACRRKWRLTDTDLCPCGETQTMSHTVESCPLTKLNGGLAQLHSADEDAVSWLTSYG